MFVIHAQAHTDKNSASLEGASTVVGVLGGGQRVHGRGNLSYWWPPAPCSYHLCQATPWIPIDSSPQSAAIMTACRVIRQGLSKEAASYRNSFVGYYTSYSREKMLSATFVSENKPYQLLKFKAHAYRCSGVECGCSNVHCIVFALMMCVFRSALVTIYWEITLSPFREFTSSHKNNNKIHSQFHMSMHGMSEVTEHVHVMDVQEFWCRLTLFGHILRICIRVLCWMCECICVCNSMYVCRDDYVRRGSALHAWQITTVALKSHKVAHLTHSNGGWHSWEADVKA